MNTAMLEGRDALTVEEFAQLRAAGASLVLLDVREPGECAVCSLPGAVHVPMNEIPQRLAELPRDLPIVVMCHHGMRSRMVAQYLRAAGIAPVLNLDGGIDAWSARIDPTLPRY